MKDINKRKQKQLPKVCAVCGKTSPILQIVGKFIMCLDCASNRVVNILARVK